MSPDKVLQKIQQQIKDLVPRLEVFVEHSIQPTSEESEALQRQLHELQENLVIYRYVKQNKELSPSFNLHARVSEAEVKPKALPTTEPPGEKPIEQVSGLAAGTATSEPAIIKEELKEAIVESVTSEAPAAIKPISVGINDKFRFINELFAQNASEYNIALEQLNTVKTWQDAELYLNSLRNLYAWNESRDVVKLFFASVKKRFD